MKVIRSTQEGHCPVCDEDIALESVITSYLSSWSHEACVVADILTRTSHSEGVTYFLGLEGNRVKIGFSSSEKGVKQRLRRAHLDFGGVTQVLGLLPGGQSLEFKMHYAFKRYSTEINEVFVDHPDVMATALTGRDHPYMSELEKYLYQLKPYREK